MLTTMQFEKIFPDPRTPEEWTTVINEGFEKYSINTPDRMACFLAQCGHETQGWTRFEENLNYSAKRLRDVFGLYFKNDAIAFACERKPEMIANRVYCNRMGNGDKASGDGYLFRGRGVIHLTGRETYQKFCDDTNQPDDFMKNPGNYLDKNKKNSLLAGLWYWEKHNLNDLADKKDMVRITKIINGGTNGLQERMALYRKIIGILP